MTEKEKMLSGQLYDASDEELVRLRQKVHALCRKYNVIGIGSVVTRNIPPNMLAVAAPCKVVRKILVT